MNACDQKVYVGNKLYRRTVWGLRKDDVGRVFGFVRFAGQFVKVWDVGGYSDGNGHWNATKPE